MIIAFKDVDMIFIKSNIDNKLIIRQYVLKHTNSMFRHIERLFYNQLFYISTIIRGDDTLSFKERREYGDILLEGTYLTGTLNNFVEVTEVLLYCNMKTVEKIIIQLRGD